MVGPENKETLSQYQYPIEHREDEPRSDIAILCPGQDVRRLGIFEEVMQYPAGIEVVERGRELLKKDFGFDILELAQKVDNPEEAKRRARILRQTQITQPLVYLWSIAVHNVNRHHLNKEGYSTIPDYYGGISMGEGTAATLAGFMDFEQGLYFHGMRGKIMQEYSDPTSTSMIAVLTDESTILRFLGQKSHKDIDLCLINSDSIFVIGGHDSEDPENTDPDTPMQRVREELRSLNIRFAEVETDRAMHGRYVRPAREEFDKLVQSMHFKSPCSAVVGTLTGLPIRDEEGMKDELMYTFDHTVDNRKPLKYFDAAGVHVFSEVHERGNFVRTMERFFGAIASNKAGVAAGAAGIIAGIAVHEVLTRHHPDNKK